MWTAPPAPAAPVRTLSRSSIEPRCGIAPAVDAVRGAPTTLKPIDAVMTALAEAGAGLANWGEPVRQRQRTIASSTELRERELIKMDALTTAVAGALRERGVEGLTATLVAQVGVAAFMTAFQPWTEAQEPRDFSCSWTRRPDASVQLSAIRTDQPCPAAIFPADSGVPGWLASGMQ